MRSISSRYSEHDAHIVLCSCHGGGVDARRGSGSPGPTGVPFAQPLVALFRLVSIRSARPWLHRDARGGTMPLLGACLALKGDCTARAAAPPRAATRRPGRAMSFHAFDDTRIGGHIRAIERSIPAVPGRDAALRGQQIGAARILVPPDDGLFEHCGRTGRQHRKGKAAPSDGRLHVSTSSFEPCRPGNARPSDHVPRENSSPHPEEARKRRSRRRFEWSLDPPSETQATSAPQDEGLEKAKQCAGP